MQQLRLNYFPSPFSASLSLYSIFLSLSPSPLSFLYFLSLSLSPPPFPLSFLYLLYLSLSPLLLPSSFSTPSSSLSLPLLFPYPSPSNLSLSAMLCSPLLPYSYLPFVGMVTILMNDYPMLKVRSSTHKLDLLTCTCAQHTYMYTHRPVATMYVMYYIGVKYSIGSHYDAVVWSDCSC